MLRARDRVALAAIVLLGLGAADPPSPVPAALPGAEPFPEALRAALASSLRERGSDYRPRTAHLRADGSPVYSNRLLLETSPYLRQHAHNPVDWRPWGEEAFAAARRLSRPVLVSIGYSTCHWCHVMEEETFDSPEIAAFLNAHFIAIKVDREARPDVDAVYMSAVQALGQPGGWPLNVWLTPDGKPFFGGTYFPPEDRGQRPGFRTVLEGIHARYAAQPGLIEQGADALASAVRVELEGRAPLESRPLDHTLLSRAVADALVAADTTWGGLGQQTKFPSALPVRLLLREHRRTGNARALALATLTLEKMAAGGIHDQLGGGFHRYATDRRWLVPHFEKMLYDNALLAVAYLEAAQLTGRADFRDVVRRTLDYVLAEMTDPAGGFHSATDADSRSPEGELEEGRFFTWTPAEIGDALERDAARLAIAWWGVTRAGDLEGRSILRAWQSEAEVAAKLEIPASSLAPRREAARLALLEARSKRPAPLRDDKILAAWNGLMIGALARAGFALDEPRYLDAARAAASFLLSHMRAGTRLVRVSLGGRASGPAFLEDYAFVIAGLLDLYEATGERRWLESALELQGVQDRHHRDESGGAYFRTAHDAERLLAREKPVRDGALPSGNSVAAANLQRIGALTGDDRHLDRLAALHAAVAPIAARRPTDVAVLLESVSDREAAMREIVLVAPEAGGDLEAMLAPVRETWVPNRVLARTREGEALALLEPLLPVVGGRKAIGGRVTAYVCERRVCRYPTSDPDELRRQLLEANAPSR